MWKGLLLSLLTLGTLLLAPEVAFRWGHVDRKLFPAAFDDPFQKEERAWWQLLTFDPIVDWKGRPFARLAEVGSMQFLTARGFRGSDFADWKPAGIKRVVCMGDSGTFGVVAHGALRFTYDPTYSSELELLLNTEGTVKKVEVINSGVIGYSSSQGLRFLKHFVRPWQPDLVTIRYGINDHWRQAAHDPLTPRNPILRWSVDQLLESRTYQLFVRLQTGRQPGGGAPLAGYEPRVALPEFDYNLRQMVSEARDMGARVVLLTAPLAPISAEILSDTRFLERTGYESYEAIVAGHQRYEDVVRKVAADLDVALLDNSRDLQRRGPEKYFTHYDLAHPNGDGHVAIARALADLIRERQLLQ